MQILHEAVNIAYHSHFGQIRKGIPLPYIVHPIEVMKMLASWGIKEEWVLAAAVLHDTLEDTKLSEVELRKFNGLIANLVLELTRKDSTSKADKAEYLASFSTKSIWAVVIKIADRICNTRDFYYEGKTRYANTYFHAAMPVFDLLDIRNAEFMEVLELDTFNNIMMSAGQTLALVEL